VLVSASTASLVEMELSDLGEHRFKDLAAPERVFQLGAGPFPALRALHRINLPVPTTPFFGRESELAELLARLTREEVRLVTLTGPGGTGKTRLALQAAAELSDGFADGVFFVPLAPLRDTRAVHAAVAEAVGLGAGDDPTAWLASRRALLVLDNLEHLPGVEAVVAELLVGATVVLATSRGPLRLSSENEMPVDPLTREAAVELFVSRAAATGREIAADETVGDICRRLDDLPLALELAAARVRLLSPSALLQRLDESLALLVGGAHDLPERQRTLRATIEWSHDLLTADEQAVFRRLSVFRGSFTLEAAVAVAGADLDQVAALVEQSLIKQLGGDRFFLLETLRAYARERLDDSGETSEFALRHARWYVGRLEENRAETYGPRHRELMAWFVSEEDNLRAMLSTFSGASVPDAARAARLLFRYWKSRGAYREARQRLKALLEHEGVPDRSRGDLFGLLQEVELVVGNLDDADAAGRESLRLAQPGSEERAYALLGLAFVAAERGEGEKAERLGREALEEIDAHALADRERIALRTDVGIVFAGAGRIDEARTIFLQASIEARRVGDPLNIFLADSNASWLDLLEERYEAAEAGFAPALDVVRGLGHASFEANTLRGMGLALLGLGRRAEARAAFTSALEILAAEPSPGVELTLVLHCIALATEPADVRPAARLAGAAAAVRRYARLTEPTNALELHRRFEPALIDAVGEDEWAREHRAGETLALGEAIELARTLVATVPETATPSV
jgi:predicted ATPase